MEVADLKADSNTQLSSTRLENSAELSRQLVNETVNDFHAIKVVISYQSELIKALAEKCVSKG
jgi:hypothetical protein